MKNNINMRLMQLEWTKKELKYITYDLNKLLELFLYYKTFSELFYPFYSTPGVRTQFPESIGSNPQFHGSKWTSRI